MRSYTLISGLSLIVPSFALVAYQPCLTTTALPTVTVIGGPDGYYNEYTRTYQEFCSQGLTKKIYTITQTCSSIDCQNLPIETAPPPGFTHAVVKCSACGGQGTQVATLTFPIESVNAYSSSGYLVEPLDSMQATEGWVDHVNAPPAVATSVVNGDTGISSASSSDQTGTEPQTPSSPGSQQDENDTGSLSNTGSHHAATEYTGSTNGNNPSDDQDAGNSDGTTSSAKGWQSGETGNNPGSDDTSAEPVLQHGPSYSFSPYDGTESQDQASHIPGQSNDVSLNTPVGPTTSEVASARGRPISSNNNTPDDTANPASPAGANGASDDASGSSGNNSAPASPQYSSPAEVDSNSKYTGNDDNSEAFDVPQIVSSASSSKLNISVCLIANAASILIVWLL